MASPQLENGYTRIANEIMEALARIRISGEARQILDFILRKTYGYQKKEDRIALSQFCAGTGLKKNTIGRALYKLISMNIVTKKENGMTNIYSIQKDFTKWKPLPKKVHIPKKRIIDTKKENLPLPKKGNTKETTTKEKKESRSSFFGTDVGALSPEEIKRKMFYGTKPTQ